MTLKCAAEPRGFTLLELLLVLAMMAAAATLVVPYIGGIGARQFDAELRDLQALLNSARRTAVVRGVDASIELRLAGAGAGAQRDNPHTLIVGHWQAVDLELYYQADSWQHSSQQALVDGRLLVTFFPEGGSSGGSLLLSQGQRQAQIDIDALTGRVALQRDLP